MHRTSSASDEYFQQVVHLMHPDLARPSHTHANEGWKQVMIRQNSTDSRRGRKKRPLDSNANNWTMAPPSFASGSETRNVMEDQERVFQHLHSRHGGKGAEAELCIRVHLESGKGTLPPMPNAASR